MNKLRIKIGSTVLALSLLLNGGAEIKLFRSANAESTKQVTMITNPHDVTRPENVKCGEFFDEDIVVNNIPCYGYVVNDENSLIEVAQRVCKYKYNLDGWDKHADKWIVLYDLNDMNSDVIWRGKVILVPRTPEIMEMLLAELQQSGKADEIKRVIRNQEQSRNTNGQSQYPVNTVGGLLSQLYSKGDYIDELYGVSVDVDDDFIEKYLELYGLANFGPYTKLSELPYPITETLLTPDQVLTGEPTNKTK